MTAAMHLLTQAEYHPDHPPMMKRLLIRMTLIGSNGSREYASEFQNGGGTIATDESCTMLRSSRFTRSATTVLTSSFVWTETHRGSPIS